MSSRLANAQPKNPIFAIALELLQSERGGFPLIEESCDLMVADCRLDSWLASQKDESGQEQLAEENWLRLLDELEGVYTDATQAWERFEASDWPKNRPDEWHRHSEALRVALRAARDRIDNLGRQFGRSNQRKLLGGDA
jgi:hypothetical protein